LHPLDLVRPSGLGYAIVLGSDKPFSTVKVTRTQQNCKIFRKKYLHVAMHIPGGLLKLFRACTLVWKAWWRWNFLLL